MNSHAFLKWANWPASLGLIVLAAGYLNAASQEKPVDEYQVKAAYLFNFARFVQWPDGTFQQPDQGIAICVLGRDPFGHWLDDTVSSRTIDGRRLMILRIVTSKQAVRCHVLFVSEFAEMSPVLREIRSGGILTIGDTDAFRANGVVINFKLEGGKVRFDIDLEAAEREQIRISSRLLSLANIVPPGHSGRPR